MTASTIGRAFVVMPFGRKATANGATVDFDRVYAEYLEPAIRDAGLMPFRADAERRGGSIHADMFQELLMAELVVADLTIDNPNVWYEIGVRHALRASGVVLTYSQRDRLPFDLNGQRMMRYAMKDGAPDPDTLEKDRALLLGAIRATLEAWRGRKASPVYATLPNLREPDWKTLKVGDVNEVWEALERWQTRVQVARRKQRPGDILVLADETPSRALQLDALRIAAQALIELKRPRFALNVLERAMALDPEDLGLRQLKGIALGRDGRFEEARVALAALAQTRRDGETLGNLARTWKDEWVQIWRAQPGYKADPQSAAKDTAPALARVAEAYAEAFRVNPADFFPGINALLFGRIWEHLTGRRSKLDLQLIGSGTQWAVSCALKKKDPSYWALVTQADLSLLRGDRDAALEVYGDAAALAVAEKDRFGIDSSCQSLTILAAVGMQKEIVTAAFKVLYDADRQLDRLLKTPAEPDHVVLFSGHLVDRPGRNPPRFPDEDASLATAQKRIDEELGRLGVGSGDLGICQAASGGDILFAIACVKRGMQVEVHLPQREPEFLRASVSFARPFWIELYDEMKNQPYVRFRIMPDELGHAPDGVSIYDRCSRWMLNAALSNGLAKVSFLALWDGKDGETGGTGEMIALIRGLTGRQPIIIDPATLMDTPDAASPA